MIQISKKIILFFIGSAALVGGIDVAIVTDTERVDLLAADMEAYYVEFQDYPHVQKGERLLGKDIPNTHSMPEYETSKGEHGFQVIYETDTQIISKGYGVQAEQRTWVKERTLPVASSTPK